MINAKDFIETKKWREKRREVMLEIIAVVFPILLYAVSLFFTERVIKPMLKDGIETKSISYFLKIPDAIFGACILFAFSSIQGYSHVKHSTRSNHVVDSEIFYWKIFGMLGFALSVLAAFFSISFQASWSLLIGLFLLYFGGLSYMKVIFYRSYLEHTDGDE